MLFKDRINPALDQSAEQEVGSKERIAHQHIAPHQGVDLAPEQGLLVASFAAAGADRGVEHGTAAQADQADDPALRESQSRLLAAGLREVGLIGVGIGHDHRGPIHQSHRTPPPVPCRRGMGR